MQRGVAYSQVQQSPAADATAAAQADALEAHSLKYHHCAQIFQLSSGRYALFGHFTNGEGIPLVAIGTWEELRPHVDNYRQLADAHASRPRAIFQKPKPGAVGYDDLFTE